MESGTPQRYAKTMNLTSPRSSKRRSHSNLPINLNKKFRVLQTIFLERDTRKIQNMVKWTGILAQNKKCCQ